MLSFVECLLLLLLLLLPSSVCVRLLLSPVIIYIPSIYVLLILTVALELALV